MVVPDKKQRQRAESPNIENEKRKKSIRHNYKKSFTIAMESKDGGPNDNVFTNPMDGEKH